MNTTNPSSSVSKGAENMPQKQTKKKASLAMQTTKFDRLSSFLVFISVFLLPIFFVSPFIGAIGVGKSVLIATTIITAFFFWLVARLKDGRLVFPKSILLFAAAAIPIAFFLSSIFSSIPKKSFIGLGIEEGTFTVMLLLFLLLFLSSVFFQDKKRIAYLYVASFVGGVVVFLYQLIRFVMLSFALPFAGVFASLPANLLGNWGDLGAFFGFLLVLSLCVFDLLLVQRKTPKLIVSLMAIISLVMLGVVNLSVLWFIVGVFSLVIFVYGISFHDRLNAQSERKLPVLSFVTLVISLFFILAGNLVSNALFSTFNVPQEVIRPTWGQTLDVTKSTLATQPIFGIGPNRFTDAWLLHRPDGVNNSPLWNVDFESGVGLIPSFGVTSGAVGIIAWVVFLVVFLYDGFFAIFSRRSISTGSRVRSILLSSFLSSLYFWVVAIFYVPNIAIFAFAFVSTGVFIATLVSHKIIPSYNISFLKDPRVGFASVLALILMILSSLGGGYILIQKFLSVGYFQKSVSAYQDAGNLDLAEQYMVGALQLAKSDLYYRTFSQMNLARLQVILAQDGVSKDTVKNQFLSVSQLATENALAAIAIDGENYQNWMTLGKVYESLIPFGAPDDFYQKAKESYDHARALNPKSPSILLAEARLELAHKNTTGAKNYIAKALNERSAYTAAIFLLSQIQANDGDLKNAIASAEVAARILPTDIGVLFQLGYLKYSNKDYTGAIEVLSRAVQIAPNYLNARYFLGLSYNKVGERQKAIDEFTTIDKYEPGNSEVQKVLRSLRARGSDASSSTLDQSAVDPENPPLED